MRLSSKRSIVIGLAVTLIVMAVPLAVWRSLTYEPDFYRKRASLPRDQLRAEADRFVAQSLQLRNDIANEGHWEASFTDEEVNAWLAEDLVEHFNDYIPEGVQDPLVAFDLDRVTFAFKLKRGPITSLVWVVARVRVPEDNTVALTLEKIRAGAMPVPADEIIERITWQARAHGLNIRWGDDRGDRVAYIRYTPDPSRGDVVLERVQVLDGRLYVSGRSDQKVGRVTGLILPDRRVLQSTFPIRRGRPTFSPST